MPVATAPLVPITGLDVFEMLPFFARLAMDMISVTIASNSLWLGKYRPSKSNTKLFCNQSYWIYRFIQDKVAKPYKIIY